MLISPIAISYFFHRVIVLFSLNSALSSFEFITNYLLVFFRSNSPDCTNEIEAHNVMGTYILMEQKIPFDDIAQALIEVIHPNFPYHSEVISGI